MDVPEVPPQAKESFAVNSPVAVGGWGSRSKEVAAGGAGGPPAGVDAVQREGRRERVELREQPPAKPGGTRMAQDVSLVPDCNMVDACPHCTNANKKNVRWSNTYPHVSTQDCYPNRSISCNLTCFSGTLQLLEDNSSWCWCWCWCCCCPAGGPAGACTSSAAAACKAWWRAHGTGGEISSRQLRARSLPAWQ